VAKATYVLILTQYGLGYTLGEFFTNSSGHPARVLLPNSRKQLLLNCVTDGGFENFFGQLYPIYFMG
jgi:hypothetical protein